MATLNEEFAIEKYRKLDYSQGNDRYRPNRDLKFYPGANLTAERRQALDHGAVEVEDLTVDDVVYSLSRLVTGTMYELVAQIEERWGKAAAKEVVREWARKRANAMIKKWAAVRGLSRINADAWARYQDLRHCVSGPIHAHSFISYVESSDDEEIVEMHRTGCFFHCGRPEGMDSYSPEVTQGMEQGYREAFPELTIEIVRCMGEGTSANGCTLRFRIKKSGARERLDGVTSR